MKKVNVIKKLLLLCMAAAMPVAATAQEAADGDSAVRRYRFSLDSTAIVLGDQTTLAIEDPDPFPSADELSGDGLVALGQRLDTATGVLYTQITSFEPGEHWLHVGGDSVLITVSDVEGVDTTTTEIKDIGGLLRQPYTFWEVFRWVLLALLAAAVAWGAVYVVRRRKERRPLIARPSALPLPPDVRALTGLENLRTQQLWQQGKAKEYHTELTDIVRRYLEEAFGIQSAEMTSDQTLDMYRGSEVCTDSSYALLREMLQTADMVKFAKSEPLPHQHDKSMSDAVGFVNETKVKLHKTEEQ